MNARASFSLWQGEIFAMNSERLTFSAYITGCEGSVYAVVPGILDFAPGVGDCVRQYARLPENRHKVIIAVPARDNVAVEVSVDSCSGGAAKIDAHVEAVGMHNFLEDSYSLRGQGMKLECFFVGEGLVDVCVPEGNHHHVAGIVGVEVHDDEACFAPMNNEVFVVFVFGGELAEEAPFVFGSFDVGHSPGSIELLHK